LSIIPKIKGRELLPKSLSERLCFPRTLNRGIIKTMKNIKIEKICEHLYKDASDTNYCVDCGEKLYYRIEGKSGVYLFTHKELDRAIDRENKGVVGVILPEKNY
jgi:hypothetical protein